MHVNNLVRTTEKVFRDNSTSILTALGISGTLTTAYLAAKASYEIGYTDGDNQLISSKEHWRRSWKLYIPAAISGALTIGCIIGGTRIGTKKTAAAYSLLTVSEKAFTEYKEKVVEQIGEKKEQKLRDDIAQDRVNNNPATIIVGSGSVLCYESHTGRYFNCDMETLRKAENTINSVLYRENEATLNDFYHLVGLPCTSYSNGTGWTSEKMMELQFSTVMSDDSRPCISFEYNYVKPL